MSLKPINAYIQNMPRSGIRRIMDSATAPDILHLEVGQPDFPTPASVIKAACEAAMDKDGRFTRYTPNMGYASLRKALVKKLQEENGIRTTENRILITPGSNYGIMIALSVLLNEGDEVLVPPRVDTKTLQNIADVTQIIYQIAVAAAVVPALL